MNRPGRGRGGSKVQKSVFSSTLARSSARQTWPGRGPAVAAAPEADTAVPGEL